MMCVGCRSVGQWGDGPRGLPFPPPVPLSRVPTTLRIPGHLAHHRPTPPRSESQKRPTHAHGRDTHRLTHTHSCRVKDNCTITQWVFQEKQHVLFFYDVVTCSHISFFPTQRQTSRMSVSILQQCSAKASGLFLYGYKSEGGQRVCASLAA